LWEQFIKDSDVVLLVSDSTLENVEKSKFFIEIIKKQTPQAHTAVIANKQDLENAIGSYQIEGILGLKTYPMIAIDSTNQKKMRQIIIDLLNMTDEIFQYSMLLDEKEKLTLELEQVKNDNNYIQASFIAKKLTDVYAKLGDDALRAKYSDLARKMDEKVVSELRTQENLSSDEATISTETKSQKISHTETLLKALIKNYMNDIKSIMAVIIFDRSGFIITSESKIESDDNLEIKASVIKMPLMFGINKEVETHTIRVICPTCKQSKKISVPKSIVKEAENVVTFSIPNNLVCKHQFQIFVDKDFAIRGYQRVDYEIDNYMDKIIKEVGTENEFFNITVTSDKKVAYCSMGPNAILSAVAEPATSDTELRVYSEHIASKIELILQGNENVSIEIPHMIKAISKTRGGKLPKGKFSAKIIMTGDYGVGKTSLVSRFVQNLFQESLQTTIGVDISQKLLELGEDTKINFVIWDIGGQISQIAPYRKRFYEGANSAFIIADLTRPQTLKNIEVWYNDIKKFVSPDINIVLVGNKSDLVEDIKSHEVELKNLANKFGFHYIFTSAKTGENVNDSFLYMAYKLLESI
jgi:Ras-related protein Rab-1A